MVGTWAYRNSQSRRNLQCVLHRVRISLRVRVVESQDVPVSGVSPRSCGIPQGSRIRVVIRVLRHLGWYQKIVPSESVPSLYVLCRVPEGNGLRWTLTEVTSTVRRRRYDLKGSTRGRNKEVCQGSRSLPNHLPPSFRPYFLTRRTLRECTEIQSRKLLWVSRFWDNTDTRWWTLP